MNLRFWVNSFLHLAVPGGWGRYRMLRSRRDPSYVHDRDKHPVRQKHFGDGGWRTEEEGAVLRRDYASYEEYTTHQRQKFDEMVKMTGGFDNRTIFQYRLTFYRRFKHLVGRLSPQANVLCAGARQGTEVEVLRELGFGRAYGIDLNPGADNELVRAGDFMNLTEASDSVDLFYTNCADHAFDLEKFFAEHARVLAPAGYALYDLAVQPGARPGGKHGVFEAVWWKRTEDLLEIILKHFDRVVMLEREQNWMWVLMQGKRKPAEVARA